jgi:HSP20 family protein
MQGERGNLMDERFIVAAPPIEAWIDRNAKEYHLSFALPGVGAQDVQLNLQGHDLTVSGDQKGSDGTQQPDYLRNEFSIGPFQRTVRLPSSVDVEKLTAHHINGTVEIVAPLKEVAAEKQTPQRSS